MTLSIILREIMEVLFIARFKSLTKPKEKVSWIHVLNQYALTGTGSTADYDAISSIQSTLILILIVIHLQQGHCI